MPAPLLLPLLTLGVGAAGQAANIAAQSSMNKKTRQWSEMMYSKQRQDSLSDWAMQNEYNSPQAQMERLRNANLNPNLVYGNGSVVANSQSQPRAANAPSWSPQAPQFRPEQAIQAFQDTKVQQAQYDNLRTQQSLMQMDLVGKSLDNRKKTVDANLKEQLYQVSVDAAHAAKQFLQAKLASEWQRQEILGETSPLTIETMRNKLLESAIQLREKELGVTLKTEEINRIKQAIQNMEKDGKLKDLQIKLTESGLQNSPWYIRAGAALLGNIF